MSNENIPHLFESAVSILNQVKSDPRSASYGDSLTQAKHYLDQAVDLTERDDPNFSNYVQTWASVHALCLAFIDYSSDLDSYLVSSPLIEKLNNGLRQNDHEQPTEELYVDEQELDNFWNGVSQIQDDRCLSLDSPALLSPGALATSVDALGEAISRSSHSPSSLYVWNLCRSIALYLKLDVYNPSEISLCISSMEKAVAPKEGSPSEDIDPFLLKAISHMLHNPQNETRRKLLRSLATFYAKRHLSMFNKSWSLYQANPDANSTDLDDTISASFEGILWTQDLGITTRFDLVFGYASAAYDRFTMAQRLEDLEDSVQFLQEIQFESYPDIAHDKISACRQLYASMLADLAYTLSQSQRAEDLEKSLVFWRQSVLATEPDTPDLAGRLFELGNLAFKLSGASEDWKPDYLAEACNAYERAAINTTDTAFIAHIYFELALTLHQRFLYTGTREDFDSSVNAGTKACDLVRQAPHLAQSDPHWSGVYRHCVKLIRFAQENFKRDTIVAGQLEPVVQLLQLIIPHAHQNRLLTMNRLGLAYTLLARAQRRGDHPTAVLLASLEKALESHEAALKETSPNDLLSHTLMAKLGQNT
ncbi:unnamed protein product [Rhizoctonia solani]|uniref:Uncharacterized protein n=1 Tax=Rhizoctonia solani TaxID=456999 RepID=A0A8H3CI56_9AGAM|nr:unnamed protein product [Rhizoctonia solani]